MSSQMMTVSSGAPMHTGQSHVHASHPRSMCVMRLVCRAAVVQPRISARHALRLPRRLYAPALGRWPQWLPFSDQPPARRRRPWPRGLSYVATRAMPLAARPLYIDSSVRSVCRQVGIALSSVLVGCHACWTHGSVRGTCTAVPGETLYRERRCTGRDVVPGETFFAFVPGPGLYPPVRNVHLYRGGRFGPLARR